MSYRNTSNLKKIIASQNSKVIRQSENKEQNKTCNCPKTKTCPLQGKCLLDNVVYQARVKSANSEETYVGLASTTFKSRLGKLWKTASTDMTPHYIWDLKDKGEEYEINWKFIGRAQPFSSISGVCNLCTLEKYHILFNPNQATLNRRDEFTNFCLHKRKLLLDKTWIPWE